jgi:RNA polymerase primary sigma factor
MLIDLPVFSERNAESATNVVDGSAAAGSLRSTCLEILTHEIGFIFNSEFRTVAYEEVEAAAESAENFLVTEVDPVTVSRLPAYIGALYSVPMLTPAGETALFRKMNFLKYWANVFRSTLDPKSPSREMIEEIQIMLDEAEKTRNQIVESNLRLVVSIARKFSKGQTSFDELVSEGNTILLKAVEKFDYSRGFRFGTYVTHSVQRHFYRYFQNSQKRRLRELPASETLSNVACESDDDAAAFRDERPAEKLLAQMDSCLDRRDQFIVCHRCGIGTNGAVRTFNALGDELGLSKERVRQLFLIALAKLRKLAAELKIDLSATL